MATRQSDKLITMSRETYHRHILRSKSAGNYFPVFRNYITSGMLPRNEAILLHDLMNHATMEKTITDKDGWFLCTHEYLAQSLAWTKYEQDTYLKKLKERGYVQTRLVGMPSKRWLFLDVERIELDLDEAEKKQEGETEETTETSIISRFPKSQSLDGEKPPSSPANGVAQVSDISETKIARLRKYQGNNGDQSPLVAEISETKVAKKPETKVAKKPETKVAKKPETKVAKKPETKVYGFLATNKEAIYIASKELKEHCRGGAHDSDPSTLFEDERKPKTFPVRMSKMLYEFLLKNRKLQRHYKTSPLHKWSIHFAELQKHHSKKEIKDTLKGYIQYHQEKYMPQACCSLSFKEKYTRIRKQLDQLGYEFSTHQEDEQSNTW